MLDPVLSTHDCENFFRWYARYAGQSVHIHDPQADSHEAVEHDGLSLTKWDQLPKADAIVLAVAHRGYFAMSIGKLTVSLKAGGCVN